LSVTCVFLSYNCERFVAEALRSMLAQDFDEPMEVIVSDDASTDSTFAVLQQELGNYRGAHAIRLVQQPTNTGSKSAHLNQVFPLAHGEILVSFDADDVFEPQRVRRTVAEFRRDPRVAAVYSQLLTIDAAGEPLGSGRVPRRPAGMTASRWYARVGSYASGGTLAIRRDVVTLFPPLDPDIYEDVVLPFRASLLGDVVFLDEPLIRARRHATSLTANFDQFSSLASYRARMERGMDKVRAQLGSRLADIDVARRLDPAREQEWRELERIAQASLLDAERTVPLWSERPVARWVTFARLAFAGLHGRDLLQNAAIAFAPETYLHYKRRRLSVRADLG
jgi:glycosyltransferase involved in cell wall biosynthesis